MSDPSEPTASDPAPASVDRPEHEARDAPTVAALEPHPVTGHHDIDRALSSLDLDADVTQHAASFADALDALAAALNPPSTPDGLRPRA